MSVADSIAAVATLLFSLAGLRGARQLWGIPVGAVPASRSRRPVLGGQMWPPDQYRLSRMALPASVSGIFITLSLVGLEESSHGGGEFWLAIGLAALAAALTALGLAVVAGATGKPAFLVPPAFRD